ncbi:hypothetical protein [Burkholderia ubonensis]|uniref:hypothetical protein n=1 Tax=Burkholderia ubonensis TaxID=101571 RepID=UPI0012FC49BD|nr:hypothetical protein [Burkholderia ubonensis]
MDAHDDAEKKILNVLGGMVNLGAEEVRVFDLLSYQDMVSYGKNPDPDFRIFEFSERGDRVGWVDNPLFFSLDKSLIVEWVLFMVEMSKSLLACGRSEG